MIKGKYVYFVFCFLYFLNNIKAQTCTVTAASSSPTLCINTALTTITHASTVATGIGSVIGFISGVVGIGGGIFLSPILFLMKASE